ncbi:MAG: hypothetical protein K8R49_06950, partial [Candidatus Cloacimonetes bacterium]|nr:hypothetical protein [Candidatus Cloacimonadota bacterium]
HSIELEHRSEIHHISFETMNADKQVETHREKDGDPKDDVWRGRSLKSILNELNITDFDHLKFTSGDNYLVRLKKEQIEKYDPIIALYRNEKKLDPANIRLVISGMSDMFWIKNIVSIKTASLSDIPFPRKIYFAEAIIKTKQIRKKLSPFVDVQGYTLKEIAYEAFPFLQDEILIVGIDGVKHIMDYEKHLKNAVLVKNGNSFNLQSPDIPAGMWIKKLAYVQFFDRALVFQNEFKNIGEVSGLLEWDKLPENVNLHINGKTENKKTSDLFEDCKWKYIEWLEW